MSDSVSLIEELVCDDRFCKYVLNPDKETVKYWDDYRKNNPDKEEVIIQARQLVLLLGDDKDSDDPEIDKKATQIWAKISLRSGKHTTKERSRGSQNTFIGFYLKVAAVLLLIGLGSFLILDLRLGDENRKVANEHNYFQRSTQNGQKASFYLPDGSHVDLNSGSSVSYYECLECSTRELILEGEAFLHVRKDLSKPFIVKTRHLSATVLGTSFNVKAYPDEKDTKVALVTGKVMVSDDHDTSRVLSPNQMAVFNPANSSAKVTSFDPEKITGWKDHVLIFDEVGLDELTKTLSRWYGVDFIISDSFKNNKKLFDRKDYKGKYKNKSLETVLEAISFSYGFDYEIRGKTVLIK